MYLVLVWIFSDNFTLKCKPQIRATSWCGLESIFCEEGGQESSTRTVTLCFGLIGSILLFLGFQEMAKLSQKLLCREPH